MSQPEAGRSRWIKQHSAGGVVLRRIAGELEFLAIKPANRDRWQLPKGTIDRGETSPQAALREVREEGGVDCRILADLGPIRFFYHVGRRRFSKRVDFYLMAYEGGSPADHDHEVQDARWFPIEQIEQLTFPSERAVVDQAKRILSEQILLSPREEVPPDPLATP